MSNNYLVIGAAPKLKLLTFFLIVWAFFITYTTLPGVNSDLVGNTIGFVIVVISWILAILTFFLAVRTKIVIADAELIYTPSFNDTLIGTRRIQLNDISKIELEFSFAPIYAIWGFITQLLCYLNVYNHTGQKIIAIPASSIDQSQFIILIKELSNRCPRAQTNDFFLSVVRDNSLPSVDKLDKKRFYSQLLRNIISFQFMF